MITKSVLGNEYIVVHTSSGASNLYGTLAWMLRQGMVALSHKSPEPWTKPGHYRFDAAGDTIWWAFDVADAATATLFKLTWGGK